MNKGGVTFRLSRLLLGLGLLPWPCLPMGLQGASQSTPQAACMALWSSVINMVMGDGHEVWQGQRG